MHPAAILLVVLLAQEAAPASPEAKARAQALLREGAQHYEHAEFADALEKFEQAYAVFPSPKLLFNIGEACRELGRPVEAIEAFERFLLQGGDVPAAMTAAAKRSIVELGDKVGKLLIECTLAGAEVAVDGKRIGEAPVGDLVRVSPGRHQITATHPGATPAIETVEVAAGTVQTVVVRLRSLAEVAAAIHTVPPPPPARPVAIEEVAPPSPRPSPGWWLGRKWTWVAAGAAVVFAGGATAAGLAMKAKFDELDRSCGSSAGAKYTGCSSSDRDAVTLRKDAANVLWGLTGAAVVAAGVLYFVEGPVTVTPLAGQTAGLLATVSY